MESSIKKYFISKILSIIFITPESMNLEYIILYSPIIEAFTDTLMYIYIFWLYFNRLTLTSFVFV